MKLTRNQFFLITLCLLSMVAAHADLIKQSATYSRTVLMTSSSDHVTGATGLTLTITASKAGAAYASVTPTVTELGNGIYTVTLATGNTGTLGALDMHVTATGADPTDTHDQVVGFDPSSDLGAAALATVNTQTAKIGTNAGDSPNTVSAQAILAKFLFDTNSYLNVHVKLTDANSNPVHH